jgi:hypothetical protein
MSEGRKRIEEALSGLWWDEECDSGVDPMGTEERRNVIRDEYERVRGGVGGGASGDGYSRAAISPGNGKASDAPGSHRTKPKGLDLREARG